MCRLRAALARPALVAVLAVGAAGCGGGTPAATVGTMAAPTIVVDRSIGPISIGLGERRVIALLGRPTSSLSVSATARGPGTLARYRSHGAALLITYDASRRVVSVETYSPYYRTATRVGPGASLERAARLPGFRQDSCDFGYWNATGRTAPGAVVTVFTPDGGLVSSVLIGELRFDTDCAEAVAGAQPRPEIAVDRSIGGVALGMAEKAVVARLGKPSTLAPTRLATGAEGALARYSVDGAPFLVTYDAARRVAAVRTFSPSFFTPDGIGPGSSRAVAQALQGFARDPCRVGVWNGASRGSGSSVTVFTFRGGRVTSALISERRLFTLCTGG